MPEYDEFKEWLHSFELYRGKKTGDDSEDENRVVGVYKVTEMNIRCCSLSTYIYNNIYSYKIQTQMIRRNFC